MSNAVTLLDIEGPVRDWLRAEESFTPPGGIFFEVPDRGPRGYPFVELFRYGGQVSQPTPMDNAFITFSIWGRDKQGKAACATAAYQLASLINNLTPTTVGNVRLLGASVVLGPRWQPDPTDGRARYVVDAVFRAVADGPEET